MTLKGGSEVRKGREVLGLNARRCSRRDTKKANHHGRARFHRGEKGKAVLTVCYR